jgi:hypothetical protein
MPKDRRTLAALSATFMAMLALLALSCSSEEKSDGDGDQPADTAADDKGSSDDGDDGDAVTAAAIDCTEILTIAEVESLFGEPAVVEEADPIANSEELGQTTCTWSTVEDEESTDDLASQLLVLQYYDGTTMSGANFYDPSVQYPDSEPLDVGDEGFVDVSGGVDTGFVDGDTSGFLSWSAVDLGGTAPDAASKKDAVVELTRAFNDRVG